MDTTTEAPPRRRLLLVASHVVQYSTSTYRKIAEDPRLDLLVAFCSMQGAESHVDPEFGVKVSWDIPLLDGYPWVQLPNWSPKPAVSGFGLINPGLRNLIRDGKFDAVYPCGYNFASAWIAILAAKRYGVPILLSSEAYGLRSLRNWEERSEWKLRLKRFRARLILSLGDAFLALSSGAVSHLKALGLPEDRVFLARYVVDNEWWTARAAEVDRKAVRGDWNIPPSSPVVLFCAKMQKWKAPLDLLEAFAQANQPDSYLVFAGDGPLRGSIEERARALGIFDRVRMLGFVNQSQLPGVYCAADLLVLPSLYEGFGLVVNEAMLCGCPVVISDCVGAKYDLVREGENGHVFPAQNVGALAEILRNDLSDREKLARMGAAARKRMETWSPREYVESLATAVDCVARSR
jgi:glycosyltransferase involved in cell wall biosynthesis